MTATKRCSKCGEVKPLTEFRKDSKRGDGHGSWCRVCKNASDRARYRRMKGIEDRLPVATPPVPKYPELRDEHWLRTQIEREFRSIAEIATMVGCSYETARLAIKRHQIPVIPYGVRRALRARLEAQREGVRA